MAFIARGVTKIAFQTSYGTGSLDNADYISRSWQVSMQDATDSIETGNLRAGLEAQSKDMVAGYQRGTVTVTGKRGIDDQILLQSAFLSGELDGTSGSLDYRIYENKGWNGTNYTGSYSVNIYRSNPDYGATKYDVAKGCVLESYNETGASGGLIEFTATYRAQSITKGATVSFTGDEPTLVQDCLSFGDVTFSDTSNTELASYSLNINNEFTDDSNVYQNSVTKLFEIPIKTTVSCDLTRVKTAYDYTLDNLILSDTLQSITIGTVSGDKSWIWTLYGKYTSATDSGDSNNVMVQNMTLQGMRDVATNNYSVLCTVDAV